jgi:choline monooxygenase
MPSLDELLARFDPDLPLAQARTIPAAWYLDPALYQAERQRVFSNCWLAVGRTDQVAGPGAFFTADVAGEPIVVVRDGEGVLRGFYNVCRHRAARVACAEQGQATRFRCRYHGWTYDLTGRLRGTPEFDGVAGFAREDNGLPGIHVAEHGPLVWAYLGTEPPPLEGWLAPLRSSSWPASAGTPAASTGWRATGSCSSITTWTAATTSTRSTPAWRACWTTPATGWRSTSMPACRSAR